MSELVPDPTEFEALREELLQTQIDLINAQESAQALFNALPVAVLMIDRQGLIHSTNTQAQQWLGGAPTNGIPNRGLLDALERSDQITLLRAVNHALTNGEALLTEPLRLKVAGQNQQVCLQARLKRLSAQGGAVHVLLALFDQSRERRIDQEHMIYKGLLDSADVLIDVFDTEGQLILASQPMLEFLEKSSDEILGKTRDAFLPLTDALRHRGADERVIRQGLPVLIREEHWSNLHGQIRTYSTRKFPVLDTAGRLLGVAGISRDITDEEQLRRWERLSEQIFQHNTEAIIVTDVDKNIVRINPAFEHITGYSAQTVLGKKPSLLKSGRQDTTFYREMWATINRLGHWKGELTNRTADGAFYRAITTISALKDDDDNIQGYVGIQSDITVLRGAQAQAQHLANYDPLTGLPNRDLLNDRLDQLLHASERRNRTFAVLFVDLDHFKEVNDSLGHAVGDELLLHIKEKLTKILRAEDTLARLGGDEFVVLLPETEREAALAVAQKLVEGLHKPVDLSGAVGYMPSLSVGVALFPDHGEDAKALLKFADTAMYQAKSAGRNRFALYRQAMSAKIDARFRLRTDLPAAIRGGELRLYLQPQFDLASRRIVGAEALVRWQRPGNASPLAPGQFLPAVAGTPVMEQLDSWVLQQSVSLLADWQESKCLPVDFHLAVNQTANDINTPTWLDRLQGLLDHSTLSPGRLEIELVESVLAKDDANIQKNLERLRQLGVSLAIDDFGTGYSNLAYLTRMPFTLLKIDMRFVRQMHQSVSDLEVVKTIITLANALEVLTLAEGVETEEQAQLLQELGCDWGQGYLVSKPMPIDEFTQQFLN